MSWSRRSLLMLPLLAACGFQPVYGPGAGGGALRDRVLVAAPETALGFALVARLEERLGRPGAAVYRLDYAIATEERGLAVTGTNAITRINVTGAVRYSLIEIATEREVVADRVSTFAAYSTTASTVATATAEEDAYDRLMTALADQIVSRLLANSAAL